MHKFTNLFKRIFLLALVAVLVCSAVGCGGKAPTEESTEDPMVAKLQQFYDLVSESRGLLDEIADDIYGNWYDAIYNDKYSGNINLAIAYAFSDHEADVDRVEELDGQIAELFKEVKESDCSSQIKAVMSAYSDYYEFVINVSGSFKSFSADKETLKKELASALKELSFEL